MSSTNVTHDGPLDIAIGGTRKTIRWKNTVMQWSELVEKMRETQRTAELYAEYMAATKDRQGEIKDIGGFVGGYLTGGRRKAGGVMHRSVLTLDIDHEGGDGLWDDFTMMYGVAAAMYSTHKHSVEAPRLRLVIPLDRPVVADEYIAIGRRVAGVLGIDMFDHTTFEPTRLMFWPSSSKDGVFEFQFQDGEWLKADVVLDSYRDWRDTSEWPVGENEKENNRRDIKTQGDPLEKKGLIGAFCNAYNIHEGIEKFLEDVYEPCAIEGRYTYKEGSTSGGLVTYDDKFAYSHHGSDPTSGKLSNAFDLVRRHKFPEKSEAEKDKMRSMEDMLEFVSEDEKTKQKLGEQRLNGAKVDFEAEREEEEEYNDKWKAELKVDKRGRYLSTINNIYLILKNDPALRNVLYFNEFDGRLMAKKSLPWRKVTKNTSDFTDDDADCFAHFLEAYKIPFTHLHKALSKIRTVNRSHPIREYLESQQWDGIERLEKLFIEYLGSEDTEYVRSVTRKTFIAAVARVYEPGVKFDTVLTLVGKQGIGKSTIISKMALDWFSDCLGDIHTKEGMDSLRGVWIMEIAEMASFKKADQDAIKRFIVSREDIYRPAYGKQQVRFQRQCIFFGTTNRQDFLSDPSGDRRFLPIATLVQKPTKDIFKDLTGAEVNQVWAEALVYYKEGESIDLSDEIKIVAERIREEYTVQDERAGVIERYLDTLLPEHWNNMGIGERQGWLTKDGTTLMEEEAGVNLRRYVCIAEIWCEALMGFQKDMTTNNTKYIHDILRKMGNWVPAKKKSFRLYGRQWAYKKVENDSETVVTREGKIVIKKKK